jgi:four helix bundle protein
LAGVEYRIQNTEYRRGFVGSPPFGGTTVSTPAATFEDLLVWRKSHALVLDIYAATSTFPKHELFGLTSQMRRAAVSVPANIAEGFKRRRRMDKVRFLGIAAASLAELRYYLRLTADLGYCE